MASELSILIVGDGGGAAQLLPAPQSPSLKCRHVSDVEAALRSVDDDRFDLIVLALRRRGEFTAFDATRLEARMPLARVIAVAGPWCEGPRRRNVDHLVGAEVVPWHRWPGWLHANIRQYERSQPAQWSLPATTSADELADFWSRSKIQSAAGRCAASGLVAIDCPTRDSAEAIGDVLASAGYATTWHAPGADALVHGACASVVEGNAWDEPFAQKVSRLREQSPAAPILLLLNFPLPEHVQAAQAAGATAVLGKPFTLAEFLGQLEELLPPRHDVAGQNATQITVAGARFAA